MDKPTHLKPKPKSFFLSFYLKINIYLDNSKKNPWNHLQNHGNSRHRSIRDMNHFAQLFQVSSRVIEKRIATNLLKRIAAVAQWMQFMWNKYYRAFHALCHFLGHTVDKYQQLSWILPFWVIVFIIEDTYHERILLFLGIVFIIGYTYRFIFSIAEKVETS